jgi:hypothetical protein
MTRYATALLAASLACAAATAFAADEMKKTDDAMVKKDTMTMQECKDHLAMAKKDGMKKDDAAMKKDAACAEMVKKDDAMMKKEEPMKK